MNKMKQYAWIWYANDTVYGLRLDLEDGRLEWYDTVGCDCDDDAIRQTIAQYRQTGAPNVIPIPPPDILAELNQALTSARQGV